MQHSAERFSLYYRSAHRVSFVSGDTSSLSLPLVIRLMRIDRMALQAVAGDIQLLHRQESRGNLSSEGSIQVRVGRLRYLLQFGALSRGVL